MRNKAQRTVVWLLGEAGITVGGENPWDIRVHDDRFYARVLGGGTLGMGESYMDRWWDAERVDELLAKLLEAGIERRVRGDLRTLLLWLACRFTNQQTRRRAFEVGRRHYDIGTDLFRTMLDRRLVYSCAYWLNAESLEEAQEAKLDLICRKLGLEPGMRLLDVGCGWGSLLQYAAERYGVEGVGITVSRQQAEYAAELCRGLPVDIRLLDYRAIEGRYDRIASVGMVEHVGWRNYATFMRTMHHALEPGGLFLLHTIGSNVTSHRSDPWLERYIFPNSMLPSLAQLASAAETGFVTEDVHNLGPYYDRTLLEWDRRFCEGWPALAERYDDRFYRMWRYYLLSSAAGFRVRRIQVWQMLLSRPPRPEPIDRIA